MSLTFAVSAPKAHQKKINQLPILVLNGLVFTKTSAANCPVTHPTMADLLGFVRPWHGLGHVQ